jgi:hypothetical protein
VAYSPAPTPAPSAAPTPTGSSSDDNTALYIIFFGAILLVIVGVAVFAALYLMKKPPAPEPGKYKVEDLPTSVQVEVDNTPCVVSQVEVENIPCVVNASTGWKAQELDVSGMHTKVEVGPPGRACC